MNRSHPNHARICTILLPRYPQDEGISFPIDRLMLVLLGRVSPPLRETRIGKYYRVQISSEVLPLSSLYL
jgi:hypothetical protein